MTDTSYTTPDVDCGDLPPSAKYVIFVIKVSGGSITRTRLKEKTDLADRTLDRALDRLESEGIVRRDRDTSDLRFVRIEIVTSATTN